MNATAAGRPLNLWSKQDIKDYHAQLAETEMGRSSWVTWSNISDGNIMPSLEGIDRIVQALLKSKNLSEGDLRVCPSLSAFSNALNELGSSQRVAFLVPTHSSTWGKNSEGILAKRTEEFYQHLVCVAVQINHGLMQVALLDPMIRYGNDKVNPENIGLGPDYDEKPFSEQELVLSHILETNLAPSTTFIYHSEVLRQKTNGCWAFAIKDALAFLKNRDFFNDIVIDKVMTRIGNRTLTLIKSLPAPFMLGAHYTHTGFETHFKNHPEQDSPEVRKKLAKHCIEELNYRIGHATVKWFKLLEQEWEKKEI